MNVILRKDRQSTLLYEKSKLFRGNNGSCGAIGSVYDELDLKNSFLGITEDNFTKKWSQK